MAVAACGARDDGLSFEDLYGDAGGSSGAAGAGGGSLPPAHADKIDLLLLVDNSGFMAEKQAILAETIPFLIDGFVNPRCAGPSASYVPADAGGKCPTGTTRLFPPVTDLHVGVVTSSLGGHGSDSCRAEQEPSENDRGRLIARTQGGQMATYQNLGFLAWDPLATRKPPGETNAAKLSGAIGSIVHGAGEKGCGFEAPHEAWYRFLVDPEPYLTIAIDNNSAVVQGTDTALLAQRAKFLRPDSLLVILVLSDENDCSIRDGAHYFFAAQRYYPGTTKAYHLPKPRAACAVDPGSKCCVSCAQALPTGCGEFPNGACDANNDGTPDPIAAVDDSINLRCWDQKRRFGIDFLYPIDRYTSALSGAKVPDRKANLVQNPIFSDLDPSDGKQTIRDARLVLFGAIVGVPWQDIARRGKNGAPDLANGADEQGRLGGGVMSGQQLLDGNIYSLILGDPAAYVTNPAARPQDPLMIESIEPRTGVHPITKQALAPPGSPATANSINGHEYLIPSKDALQYSCIFRLAKPISCDVGGACACSSAAAKNPLCEDPAGNYTGIQLSGHAFPGIRHLQLAKSLGPRATVGSICPASLGAPNTLGYQPLAMTLIQTAAPLLAAKKPAP